MGGALFYYQFHSWWNRLRQRVRMRGESAARLTVGQTERIK